MSQPYTVVSLALLSRATDLAIRHGVQGGRLFEDVEHVWLELFTERLAEEQSAVGRPYT